MSTTPVSTHPLLTAHTVIPISYNEETPLLSRTQIGQHSLWEPMEPRSQTEANNVFVKSCLSLGTVAGCIASLLFLASDTPMVAPFILTATIVFTILPSDKIIAAEAREEAPKPAARPAQTPITPNNNSRRPDLSQEEPATPENLELLNIGKGKGKMVASENSTPFSIA